MPDQNWKPQLTPITLSDSQIQYECFTWSLPKKYGAKRCAGLITFRGMYRRGSAGEPDARFIKFRLDEFCAWSNCQSDKIIALVVDLTQLDYVWGDNLNIHTNSTDKLKVLCAVIPPLEEAQEIHEALQWALADVRGVFTRRQDAFNYLIHELA